MRKLRDLAPLFVQLLHFRRFIRARYSLIVGLSTTLVSPQPTPGTALFPEPDLSADSIQLKTSSVVWSSQREPLKAAVGEAEKGTKRMTRSNPLIVGDEKVVPNITKVFRRSQNLYISFDVYDAAIDPDNTAARRVAVSMSLFNQKGVKTFEAGPLKATELASTRPNVVPVQLQVPLKGIAPGHYTCQINVVDEVGRRFAFPRTPLVVQ